MTRNRRPAIPLDPIVAEAIAEDPTLLKIPRRTPLRRLDDDGLPEMADLIRSLTQEQRDAILRAMPTTGRKAT